MIVSIGAHQPKKGPTFKKDWMPHNFNDRVLEFGRNFLLFYWVVVYYSIGNLPVCLSTVLSFFWPENGLPASALYKFELILFCSVLSWKITPVFPIFRFKVIFSASFPAPGCKTYNPIYRYWPHRPVSSILTVYQVRPIKHLYIGHLSIKQDTAVKVHNSSASQYVNMYNRYRPLFSSLFF